MSKKLTALYTRISREDGDKPESCSIETQKRILTSYAEQNGLVPYKIWVDDGASGKDFQRPAFQEMYAEIEKGNIGTVAVKELDRFGRAYLESGMYREEFRKLGVRFISLAENLDSANGDGDDFTPFREVINEFYLRQYSKKIKAAYKSRGLAGKHTSSFCPYGYYKSPEDKNQWLIDSYAADVVRRVFRMTMDGKGPYQICCELEAEKILTPGAYLAEKGTGLHKSHVFENPYHWTSTTVCSMLKKQEYLGHTVNFKSKKESYKDKKNTYVPEDEWLIFPNTHEPIIDQATFDNVQRIRGNVKRYPDGFGYVHPLTGLVRCADCGGKLYVHRITNGKDRPMYVCGNYNKIPVGSKCVSAHRISADTLMELIAETLRKVVKFAETDRAEFAKLVQETLAAKQTGEVKAQKKRLAACNKRLNELEILYPKIYEDYALGKLPEKQFAALSEKYVAEQTALEKEAEELTAAIGQFEGGAERAEQFMELVERYENFDELTPNIINEFVEKVVVYERDRKGSIQTTQRIDIHLNFIGEFEIPQEEIDPAELAAQEEARRKREETKDRLHRNYLSRKERGVEAIYYQRRKERERAQAEATAT
ncbi:recombinase [Clostridia bacterium]|nr:recombinase [Clostridia bacterium]